MKTTSVVSLPQSIAFHRHPFFRKSVSKPYVISEDIDVLLCDWAKRRNFSIPDHSFFREMRAEFYTSLQECLGYSNGAENIVHAVSVEELKNGMTELIGNISMPIVSVDTVYTPREFPVIEITRMVDRRHWKLGTGSRTSTPIKDQISALPESYRSSPIAICDDVVFGGDSIIDLIVACEEENVTVGALILGISVRSGIDAILNKFPHVRIFSVREYGNVRDEICERDFWIGVPQSGRLVGKRENGIPVPIVPETGVPYLLPFGSPKNVTKWSTLEPIYINRWSHSCLSLSIRLWEEVGRISGREVLCSDIERIPFGFPNSATSFVKYLRGLLHPLSAS